MLAGDSDSFFDVVGDGERIRDFSGGRDIGDFDGFRIERVINHIVGVGLETADVGFGGSVLIVIFVDVEVVWFDSADYGDMGGFV